MRFGIHVPKETTLTKTTEYAIEIRCQTMQIFSGNPIGWTMGRLDRTDARRFEQLRRGADIEPVLLHAPYLINLAATDRDKRRLSRRALAQAMIRSVEIAAGPVVVHAGNHRGAGSEAGIARAIDTIGHALDRAPAAALFIENGAGKGTEIGVTFEELARMVEPFPDDRVGILLDTAHLWAMGHDLRKPSAYAAILAAIDRGPGSARIGAIHANDSLMDLGSRTDHHCLWGEGKIGRRGLTNLIRARGFSHLPVIFEVPGPTPEFEKRRLAAARRLDRRRQAEASGA
jgi:deoxyribonuclease-4